jgi:crotonobetainyl-CoA:carnitine CoA-transferase CaiB-like acyl-CoA transferase
VNEPEDALYNEQTEARGVMTELEDDERTVPVIEHPLNYGTAESGFDHLPPELGEHTREVLREVGYDEETLDELAAAGAFGDPE